MEHVAAPFQKKREVWSNSDQIRPLLSVALHWEAPSEKIGLLQRRSTHTVANPSMDSLEPA